MAKSKGGGKPPSLGVIPIQPDLFLNNGMKYYDILKWVLTYMLAKIADLTTNPYQEKDNMAYFYNVTILTLEKTLVPLEDEEFRREVARINKEFSDAYPGKRFWYDTAFGRAHFEAIMRLLSRRGVLTTEPPKYQLEMMPDDIIEELLTEED